MRWKYFAIGVGAYIVLKFVMVGLMMR